MHPWHTLSTMGFLVDDKQALVNMLWNLGLVTDQCKCVKEMFSYVLQTQTADQKIWFLKDVCNTLIMFFLKLHLRHFPLNIVKLTKVSIVAQTMHANDTKMNQMTPNFKRWGSFFSFYSCLWNCFFSAGSEMILNPESLWPNDAIWWHRSESKLVQVMACCLTTPTLFFPF